MLIAREQSESNLIRAWEPGRIRIGETWHESHVIVTAETVVSNWTPRHPASLTIEDLAPALELEPELLIIGAGMGSVSPDVHLMSAVAAYGIGLEYMRTPAACRTYNVLVHEGRRVAAALLQRGDSV